MAEEVAQGIGSLAALEVLAPDCPGYGGGVDLQLLRQGQQAHGGQLAGLSGEEGALGLQDGLGAAAQGAAPPLQTVQQPFGLLHLLL